MFRLRTFKKLAILAILLTVPVYVLTGCERIKVDNVFEYEGLDFIDTPWEIVSVNDQPIGSLLESDTESLLPAFAVTANSLVFHASGDLTGEIQITLSGETPGDVAKSEKWEFTYTITGKYTVEETTLTIDSEKVEIDVVVTLTPREAWEQQIEGITFEQLQDELATANEMEFTEDDSPFPFTVDVNYTQQTEENTLTLSSSGEKILLKKKTE